MDFYETLGLIATICLVLCILFAALAVALFFLFKIPKVIGFLSGSTARKSVKQLEGEAAASGALKSAGARKQSHATQSPPIPDAATPIAAAPYAQQPMQPQAGGNQQTAYGNEGAGATSLLNEAGATSLLGEAGATSLLGEAGATSLLSAQAGATSLLSASDPIVMSPQMQNELGMGLTETLEDLPADFKIGTFNIIQKIVFVHAEEVI